MASNGKFALSPTISITRSKFPRNFQHKTSFELGSIVPLYWDEVVPGDTCSLDLSAFVRMSTPITDIMDNIYMDFYAFFVPNRLLWEDWKHFMGENDTNAGIAGDVYLGGVSITDDNYRVTTGSLGDYLGLPLIDSNEPIQTIVSAFPGKAYAAIYNRWFRDQNLIPPLEIRPDDQGICWVDETGHSVGYSASLLKAAKFSDYFTRCLPYAQKGEPVTLPIGSQAPVIFEDAEIIPTGEFKLKPINGSAIPHNSTLGLSATYETRVQDSSYAGHNVAYEDGLSIRASAYADLSQATATTINSLRWAFAYQRMLEKDALYGTRYWEILKGHFGVESPDASLQDPEYLGGTRIRINIDQVLSTSGADVSAMQRLGAVGAVSCTGSNSSLFTKSFTEHGILMVVGVVRHDQTYGQGLARKWTRSRRFDFYDPTFANLGSQPILNKEIFCQASDADNQVFGYQEAWADYRFLPNQVSGYLNPCKAQSLGFWTLANYFGQLPTLSRSFIEQDRNPIARALTTGTFGPDFIGDFYFQGVWVRPMPTYSIPGKIDHA